MSSSLRICNVKDWPQGASTVVQVLTEIHLVTVWFVCQDIDLIGEGGGDIVSVWIWHVDNLPIREVGIRPF